MRPWMHVHVHAIYKSSMVRQIKSVPLPSNPEAKLFIHKLDIMKELK